MAGDGDSTKKMPPGRILPIDPRQPVLGGSGQSTKRMAVDHVLPLPGQPPVAESGEHLTQSGRARMPARVGDITLCGELARGGMGVVYEGRHEALGRKVAVKLLRGGAQASAEDVQRFQLEAKAVARLSHPNIVGLHQVGEERGFHYIVMDLVEGDTLHQRLERFGAFKPETAARIVRDLALALDHAHGQGILHRDVKPANVLLTQDGRPLLTDFGLAKVQDSQLVLTITGEVVGTPAFMSPEQARGLPLDERTDVYALGCVLFQALTGQVPFPGDSPVDVMNAVVSDLPPRPSTLAPVPDELEDVCWRCLSKDPAKRPQSAAELASELSAALPELAEPPAVEPVTRAPWLAWAIAGLGLTAAAGVVLTRSASGPASAPPPVASAAPTPSGEALADARLEQARALLEAGEQDGAAAQVEEALLHDAAPARLRQAAQLLEESRRLERARELLDEYARVQPPALDALARSRELELRLDPDAVDALGPLEAALGLTGPELEGQGVVLLAQAEALRLQRDWAAAEALYREALIADPGLGLAHLGLGLCADAQDARLDAQAACERALELSPDLLPASLLRLDLLRRARSLDEALAGADALVAFHPEQAGAWVTRAGVRLDRGELEEARVDASRAIALDPESGAAYAVRARVAVARRSFLEAFDEFTQAIQRQPPGSRALAESLSRRGFVQVQLGRKNEAREDLERARDMLGAEDSLRRSIEKMLPLLNARRD